MFGNNLPTSGLTFTKILGGISKTLSVANQVIPLYQEAKPMINNAKTIFGVIKGLNNNDVKKERQKKNIKPEIKSHTKKDIDTKINTPTFFQ